MLIKKNSPHTLFTITLPSSKSISNRALVLEALSGVKSQLKDLSSARDTQTMIRLLATDPDVYDVLDAGTTMRFLTAYLAVSEKERTITGTARMQERPIAILVEALSALGADITYEKKEGYPPLNIGAFTDAGLTTISMRGDISSQYISAIMMVSPLLKSGLSIQLEGKVGSRPYIDMTASLMRLFGAHLTIEGNTIHVKPGGYKAIDYTIEKDWSAASYWYSVVALSEGCTVLLSDLTDESIQGDRVMADIMFELGVKTEFTAEGALLSRRDHAESCSIDFTHCPDLAQTVAVVCAAKGIKGQFTGLESLKIKETDRIQALQNELNKINAAFSLQDGNYVLEPGDTLPPRATIDTYDDHRMAMAFAPLGVLMDVDIINPEVVNKSYPSFWDDFKIAGLI